MWVLAVTTLCPHVPVMVQVELLWVNQTVLKLQWFATLVPLQKHAGVILTS